MADKCPYCGSEIVRIKGSKIYNQHDKPYSDKIFFACERFPECDAFVGSHHGKGKKSLGTIANKKTRMIRHAAHSIFDQLWMRGKKRRTKRKLWYEKLSEYMNLDIDDTHIGMFDYNQCKKVIEFSKKELRQ